MSLSDIFHKLPIGGFGSSSKLPINPLEGTDTSQKDYYLDDEDEAWRGIYEEKPFGDVTGTTKGLNIGGKTCLMPIVISALTVMGLIVNLL